MELKFTIILLTHSFSCFACPDLHSPVERHHYYEYCDSLGDVHYIETNITIGQSPRIYSRLLNALYYKCLKYELGYGNSTLCQSSCLHTLPSHPSPEETSTKRWSTAPRCVPSSIPKILTTLALNSPGNEYQKLGSLGLAISHDVYISTRVLSFGATDGDDNHLPQQDTDSPQPNVYSFRHGVGSMEVLHQSDVIDLLTTNSTQRLQTIKNMLNRADRSRICSFNDTDVTCMDDWIYRTPACLSSDKCVTLLVGEVEMDMASIKARFSSASYPVQLVYTGQFGLLRVLSKVDFPVLLLTLVPNPLSDLYHLTPLKWPECHDDPHDCEFADMPIHSYVWSELVESHTDQSIIGLAQDLERGKATLSICRLLLQAYLKYMNLRDAEFVELMHSLAEYLDLSELPDDDQIVLTEIDSAIEEAICSWLSESENIWRKWLPDGWDEKPELLLGGLFPTGVTSVWRLPNIIPAAQLAVDRLNMDDNVLQDYRMDMLKADTRCEVDWTTKSFVNFIKNESVWNKMVGGLGPACADTALYLADLAKHFNFILISYSVDTMLFSFNYRKQNNPNAQDDYPTFFRTVPQISDYANVYLELFKRFGWDRVSMLVEGQSSDWLLYHEIITREFEKHNIKVTTQARLQRYSSLGGPTTDQSAFYSQYLQPIKDSNSRVIIIDVYEPTARRIVCQAYKMGMTLDQDYVWFLPSWYAFDWYDSEYISDQELKAVGCNKQQLQQAVKGYFSLKHANLDVTGAVAAGGLTGQQFAVEYRKLVSGDRHLRSVSEYGSYAYDGVFAFALALDSLAKDNPAYIKYLHSTPVTLKYMEKLRNLKFQGVSGVVSFNEDGDRSGITNIQQFSQLEQMSDDIPEADIFLEGIAVGKWTPNPAGNQSAGRLELDHSLIKWGKAKNPGVGPPATIPTPPDKCKWPKIQAAFNTSCDNAFVIMVVLIAFSLLVLVVVLIAALVRWKYKKNLAIGMDRIREMQQMYTPLGLDSWETPRERIVLNRKLGEGAFGTVYGGEADIDMNWIGVAVKTLKVGSSTDEKLDFLSEADTMKRFDHRNIVKLLGVTTIGEPAYAIMEFMLYGDLRTFLLSRRELVGSDCKEAEDITPHRLTQMALDVIEGLQYLHSREYIHRDIASRNCLVSASKSIKIGDFGMARPVYDHGYYRLSVKGKLPIRWMAPESLVDYIFTYKTDIWSYGVLLYEIITFGSCPYQAYSNEEVLEWVKSGRSLPLPDECTDELKSLLLSLWNHSPIGRPMASEIAATLTETRDIIQPLVATRTHNALHLEDPADLALSPLKLVNKKPSLLRQSSSIVSVDASASRARNPSEVSSTGRRGKRKSSNSALDVSVGGASMSMSPTRVSLPSPSHSIGQPSNLTFARSNAADNVFFGEYKASMRLPAPCHRSYGEGIDQPLHLLTTAHDCQSEDTSSNNTNTPLLGNTTV